MLIDNRTKLDYEAIGQIIDKYIADSDPGQTLYVGKKDYFKFRAYGKVYNCHIIYLKRYVKYIVEEARDGRKN